MKKIFYLHVPELTGWQSVFAEMVGKMDSSGMLDAVDEVHLCLNGVLSSMEIPLFPLLRSSDKFKIRHVNGDAAKWEWPTIDLIKKDADASAEDYYIGYAHLKALSRPSLADQKGIDWRHYLSYWTIERWADNFSKLDEGFEVVGINWMDNPWPHMSGNFWWSRANYVRRLKPLQDPATITPGTLSTLLKPNITLDPGNVRFESEAWIGHNSPRTFELHSSHPKGDIGFHYNNEFPSDRYRND